MLPAISMLRLCNRFGQGPEAFITRLPAELLNNIEYRLMEPVRRREVALWEGAFGCFEQKCELPEHVDWEDKVNPSYVGCPRRAARTDPEDDGCFPPREEGTYHAIHRSQRSRWRARVASFLRDDTRELAL